MIQSFVERGVTRHTDESEGEREMLPHQLQRNQMYIFCVSRAVRIMKRKRLRVYVILKARREEKLLHGVSTK